MAQQYRPALTHCRVWCLLFLLLFGMAVVIAPQPYKEAAFNQLCCWNSSAFAVNRLQHE
jgi:hypothetical protein